MTNRTVRVMCEEEKRCRYSHILYEHLHILIPGSSFPTHSLCKTTKKLTTIIFLAETKRVQDADGDFTPFCWTCDEEVTLKEICSGLPE